MTPNRSLLLSLLLALAIGGCTSDGRVRQIDGRYYKCYPERSGAGWYYVDMNGDKIHLDKLPAEKNLYGDDEQFMPKEHPAN